MLAELPRERENGLVAPPALVALDAVTLVKALRLGVCEYLSYDGAAHHE